MIRAAATGDNVEIFVNSPTTGAPTYSIPGDQLGPVHVNGAGGDDSLTIDFSSGKRTPSLDLSFDGGGQATAAGDGLWLVGTPGNDLFSFSAGHVSFGPVI